MLIRLDMASDIPIYVQLRNQIVMGIGTGALKVGERLPTVRQMAADAGVNTMTVNKTYQLLKAEGFIEIDRRKGAVVNPVEDTAGAFREKLEGELALLGAEAKIKGMEEREFLQLCGEIFAKLSGQDENLQFE
ncbi:MAG: GntR family transcriptional regulator [[Ruminococcus] gnavus]|nr:GntR family transcriptional regulator [Mediterraneibacter gnavus]